MRHWAWHACGGVERASTKIHAEIAASTLTSEKVDRETLGDLPDFCQGKRRVTLGKSAPSDLALGFLIEF